ncbi:MAG: SDR family NAD(P)-dependent oxidoreductase, partial [Acidobacteria bacterium]|nr:SDR family NAD(P)-dependent oxidoreductase [Acidobacteriota bacterium]
DPAGAVWGASLRPETDAWATLLETAGALWAHGVPIDWRAVDGRAAHRRVALPTYPFARTRFWIDAAMPQSAEPEDPLAGVALRSPAIRASVFEAQVAARGYLADHRICDAAVLPLTAYLRLVGEATSVDGAMTWLDEVRLDRPIRLREDVPVTVQAIVSPDGNAGRPFEVVTLPAGASGSSSWVRHASGRVGIAPADAPGQPPAGATPGEIRARCQVEESPSDYYARLRACGLEYGPAFRHISGLWCGDGEALARVEPPAGEDLHAGHFDAFLQAVFAAMPAERLGEALYLPVAARRIAFAGSMADARWSHVTLAGASGPLQDAFEATVRVLDEQGRALVQFSSLTLKRTSRRAPGEQTPRGEHLMYGLTWHADPPGGAADERSRWHRPASGLDIEPAAREAGVEHHLDVYAALEAPLDALCAQYVAAALGELGWHLAPGSRRAIGNLADSLGVLPAYRRMLARMLAMLEEDGTLARDGDTWRVVRAAPDGGADAALARLQAEHPACRAELTMVGRCGAALAPVLRGAVPPLDLLFPNGSLNDLEAIYRDAPFARAYNALVARLVRQAISGAAAGRAPRILEVGAGTGGTASAVLPLLAGSACQYVYTDVSTLFLAKARSRFAGYPFVDYRILDIEREPEAQGFGSDRFDLVIATNVLHATADLAAAVTRVHRLLAPGGLLVAVEGMAPQRWVDLIFGLTEGWWKFTDADLRADHPLIDVSRWRALLSRSGFEDARIVPDDPAETGFFHQRVIVSTRSAAAPSDRPGREWLICGDEGPAAARLAAKLRERGDAVVALVPPAISSAHDFRAMLGELPASRAVRRGAAFLSVAPAAGGTPTTDQVMQEQEQAVGRALHLVQAIAADPAWRDASLALVTAGAQPVGGHDVTRCAAASLWGFGRTLALEHPELRCRRIDLDPGLDEASLDALARELTSDTLEDEVGIRRGERHVARLEPAGSRIEPAAAPSSAAAVQVRFAQGGALDGLALAPAERRPPGPGEVEIQVAYAGLNFKDVLHALDVLPARAAGPGLECAGRIAGVGAGVEGLSVGDRVIAIASEAFRSHVTVPSAFVVRAPRRLSLSEAATIPSAFLTAWYALVHVARIRRGDRVLVHAATGGVGMAAVQIARSAGAELFATAGSEAKRQRLFEMGIAHVMDSRAPRFLDEIRIATGGAGVDVVLSSVSGELAAASLAALAAGGRFVELGKSDVLSPEEAARRLPAATYAAVDVGEAFRSDPPLLRSMLLAIVAAIERGELRPLPAQLFPAREVASAFRLMAQARHIGKVVVSFEEAAAGARSIRRDASYLITGGFGGLGLRFAHWLAGEGAASIVLMGRHAPAGAALESIEALRRRTRVTVSIGDAAVAADVDAVFREMASALPPLGGVIHAAGIVDDGVVVHQDWQRFERVMAAKVRGSWNLHLATETLPLDFFLLFSTTAALLGSAGQSNHAAANAFMDALAAYRRAHARPGLSINWGPWAEIGAAVTLGVEDRLAGKGLRGIAPDEGVAAVRQLLEAAGAGYQPAQIAVIGADWPAYLRKAGLDRSPRLAALAGARVQEPTASGEEARSDDRIVERVRAAGVSQRAHLLGRFVASHVAKSLGLRGGDEIHPEQPLAELGLDSLLAVELRAVLGVAFGQPLPATLVFDYPTLQALTGYLGRTILAVEPWTAAPEDAGPAASPPRSDALSSIEQMADDDVERLLANKLAGTRG